MDAARNPHDKRPVFGQSGPALTLSGITRQFGAVRALNNVSLDVHEGEIICLVGHSGCGKTSLLRIIAGIDVPDSGTLTMGGRRWSAHPSLLSLKNGTWVSSSRITLCFRT